MSDIGGVDLVVNGLKLVVVVVVEVVVVGGCAVDMTTTEEGVMIVSLGAASLAASASMTASGFNVGAVRVSMRSTRL